MRAEAETAGDASLEPPLERFGIGRRLAAEALGTALLLAVIGSGIWASGRAETTRSLCSTTPWPPGPASPC